LTCCTVDIEIRPRAQAGSHETRHHRRDAGQARQSATARRHGLVRARWRDRAVIPEPWPDAVDGVELPGELSATILRYVIMTPEAARSVAMWIVFTHCFAIANFALKLVIRSAMARSGKTRLLEVLSYLGDRPQTTSNITAAGLYRLIDAHYPTLPIDEADTFVTDNEELRGIINSGFDRRGARVSRFVPVGDGWDLRDFSTWCPQAIVRISKLGGTVTDHSIVIQLKRKMPTEKVARLRDRDTGPLRDLSRQTARWAADYVAALEAAQRTCPRRSMTVLPMDGSS
jgi:putative DNA primase/helicase